MFIPITVHDCTPVGTMQLEEITPIVGMFWVWALLFAMSKTGECFRYLKNGNSEFVLSLAASLLLWGFVIVSGMYLFSWTYAINYCSHKLQELHGINSY